MYSYIIGVITQKEDGKVTVENNGIGYELFVSNQTLETFTFENEPVKLFTYLNVREDEMTLYGFATIEEKKLFLQLTSVSGIGPKMAISILSEISIAGLMTAIASDDLKTLCKIKGLGKKTAEKLLIELRDKVNMFEALALGGEIKEQEEIDEDVLDDAISALTGLGIGKNEAYRRVKDVYKKDMPIEEIITNVLRGMSK